MIAESRLRGEGENLAIAVEEKDGACRCGLLRSMLVTRRKRNF